MSNRKLLVLSLVFLSLLAFVVFFERHQPNSEEAAKARKKLVDFKTGEVTAIGKARRLALSINGSGDADLASLTLTDADVDITGSGEARVGPTGNADITISGSGDVTLTERPAKVSRTISGSGSIDESF